MTITIFRLQRKDQPPSKQNEEIELINYEACIEKKLVFIIRLFFYFFKFVIVPFLVDLLTFVVL